MHLNREEALELIEALMDMVNQHCTIDEKQYNQHYVIDSALSSNEVAFEVLEGLGLLKRGKPRGCYKLQWDTFNKIKTDTFNKKYTWVEL